MNIALIILWYLIGYVGCIWAVSRKYAVTETDFVIFLFFAVFGPVVPLMFVLFTADSGKVVIRRRK
jgi:lipid-A-disaccharide synthase-like uncharacterized protein